MPLVSDPRYAHVSICFDVHNLVGRCELGSTGLIMNSYGYPRNVAEIGLAKVRLAAEYAGLHRGANVCLVFSAEENSSVRRAVYPAYKSTRPVRAPLHVQVGGSVTNPVIKTHDGVRDFMELVKHIPSCTLHMPDNDGETDDAIATFAAKAAPRPVIIVTEDRDMWSLMSPRVQLFSKPDMIYGLDAVEKKWGIREPWKVPLVKALYGDDSDAIAKPVAFVTPKSVGDLVDRVVRRREETMATPQFLSLVEAGLPDVTGRKKRVYEELLDSRAKVLELESITKLRRVRLAIELNTRNLREFESRLDWYELPDSKHKSAMQFCSR